MYETSSLDQSIGNGINCSDKNHVKAGPDRDKEKKQTRWASSTDAYAQLCKITTDMFYYACAILASELSKL